MHTRPGRGRTPGSEARRTSCISWTAASPESGLAARGRSDCTVGPSASLPGRRELERDSRELAAHRGRLASERRRLAWRRTGYKTRSRPRYVHRTDCRTGRGLLFGGRGIIALLKNFRLSFRVGNSEKPTRAGPQTYSAESPCAPSSSRGLPFGRIRDPQTDGILQPRAGGCPEPLVPVFRDVHHARRGVRRGRGDAGRDALVGPPVAGRPLCGLPPPRNRDGRRPWSGVPSHPEETDPRLLPPRA